MIRPPGRRHTFHSPIPRPATKQTVCSLASYRPCIDYPHQCKDPHGTMGLSSDPQQEKTDLEHPDGRIATWGVMTLTNFSRYGIGVKDSGEAPFFLSVGLTSLVRPNLKIAAAWRLAIIVWICIPTYLCEHPSLQGLTCRGLCVCSLPHIVPQKVLRYVP